MVFRLIWRSNRSDEPVRIYGNRQSIRETLAILLVHPQRTLNLRVEAILDATNGDGVTDVTQEFALEHVTSALRRN